MKRAPSISRAMSPTGIKVRDLTGLQPSNLLKNRRPCTFIQKMSAGGIAHPEDLYKHALVVRLNSSDLLAK